jgi:phosphomannomutase
MKTRYIFDVDGTLTPSRSRINEDFRLFFAEYCDNHLVYLVTGSDRLKTLEQLGSYLVDVCVQRSYQCSGADVWERGNNIRSSAWFLPIEAKEFLCQFLEESDFPKRTGMHFDHRPGLCNFSVVGRGANRKERNDYIHYDHRRSERERIVTYFNAIFTDLHASVAGEIGIDITPKGFDKSQILKDFDVDDRIIFIGDATQPGGNDFEISKKVLDRKNSKCYSVNSWKDTWALLKS